MYAKNVRHRRAFASAAEWFMGQARTHCRSSAKDKLPKQPSQDVGKAVFETATI